MNLLFLIAATTWALFPFCGSAQRSNQRAVKGLLSLGEVEEKTGKSPQQWSRDFWTRIFSNNADTSPIHGNDYIASKYGNKFDFDGKVSMGEFLFIGGLACPNAPVTPCESEGVKNRVFSIDADVVKYLAFPLIISGHWQEAEDLPGAALDRCETRANYYTSLRGVVVATAKVDGETLPGLNGDPTINLKDYYVSPPFDDDSIMYVNDVKVHSNPILGTSKANSTLNDELVCTHGFFVFLSLEDYADDPDINIYFKADLYNPEDLTEHWFGLEIDYTIYLEREEPLQDLNRPTTTGRRGTGDRHPSSEQPREDGRTTGPRLNRRSSHPPLP